MFESAPTEQSGIFGSGFLSFTSAQNREVSLITKKREAKSSGNCVVFHLMLHRFFRLVSSFSFSRASNNMWFWASASQYALNLDGLKQAENKLLQLARQFGNRAPEDYDIRLLDTHIPHTSVPLSSHSCQLHENLPEGEYLMHGIEVKSRTASTQHSSDAPLVMLHGYMNGAAYFYRNLVGLSNYFSSVVALDMLGWGLSSRPNFKAIQDDTLRTTEDFFVESLEAWRHANKIDRMVLAGHSMGGYLSVAYCEKYPDRVERLILISPVGVPEESQKVLEERKARIQASLQGRLMYGTFNYLFGRQTPGDVLRMLPTSRSERMIQEYVRRRLPAIDDEKERVAVSEYLYRSAVTLPASGEYCINRILTPGIFAKEPALHRIPHLKVPSVGFLYGAQDWMDSNGGLQVQQAVEAKRSMNQDAPRVDVYQVSKSGHLLMLDNWEEFNAGMITSAGGIPSDLSRRPIKLEPSKSVPPIAPVYESESQRTDVSTSVEVAS